MLLWSMRSTTLEVIKEEVDEMEKNTSKQEENNEEDSTEGNDNEDSLTDETDKGLRGTEEEEDEKKPHENKDEQRKQIENRDRTDYKNGALQKTSLCVTFSEEEDIINSHQIESVDENRIGTGFLIEEQEKDGTREPFWNKWKKAFSWNDFFYAIIFGLGPTSWDVLSDLRFGGNLKNTFSNLKQIHLSI